MEVSVIIPVYNVKDCIYKCVDSVINQSFDANKYEIILVDDGSTDGSGLICDEYEKKYSNIVTFHKKNGGLSDARNYGMKYAKGKYFTFIDSDDAIGYDFLSILYNLIEKYDVSISTVGSFNVRDINEAVFARVTATNKERKLSKLDGIRSALIRDGFGISAWAYLYDRKLFNDISYPVGALYEDLFTTPYVLDRAEKGIAVSDAAQYVYYVRKDSITHRKLSKKDLIWFKGMDKLRNYFKNKYGDKLNKEIQARYLTDMVGILCNRAVFEENATELLKMFLKRDPIMWSGYLRNPFISYRMKAQILVLRCNWRIYRSIIKLFI